MKIVNLYQKIVVILFLMVCSSSLLAGKINQVIFFGDSLSDNGNLYKRLLKILPKSPPYFQGRFTNGQTWAEHVGNYYYEKEYADYKIYAVGGATAIFHLPKLKFTAPTNLELEVRQYLLDALLKNKKNVLYVIWIGGNDYLFDEETNPDEMVSDVVNKIAWSVNYLIDSGAEHFLVLNLPNLSRIPYGRASGMGVRLAYLSKAHNLKLDEAMKVIRAKNPRIQLTLVNVYDTLNEVIDNPKKYNEKYHVNIVETREACWKGGYFSWRFNAEQGLENELKLALADHKEVDAQALNQFLLGSPVARNTFLLGQSYAKGNQPCSDASQYLFWDEIHPSEVVHRVLSQIVIENLASMS